MKNNVASAEQFFPDGMAFKTTRERKECGDYLHIGLRLRKKLKTHHWHLLRSAFGKDPHPDLQPEFFTYEAVIADAKVVTPRAICKLLAKAAKACDVAQIMWPNRQNGIQFATDGNGYYFATPVTSETHSMSATDAA
jgi:hypothetical protein